MVKFLDLQKQYGMIKSEIDKVLFEVIESSAFIGGKFLASFESEFAEYTGRKFCIGTGNGTDALEAALWSLDLPKGSEVIIPANTFIATAEAVINSGLKVVFADCKDDYTLCPSSFESLITENTSAVIPVHLYGNCADMDKINSIAKKHDLKVIEDAAQAHGATYNGKKAGALGDIATFSFYPGKNLGAYGDGGAVVTDCEKTKENINKYIFHGRKDKFTHDILGRNSRLDGLQAAVLSVKLKHLDSWISQRNEAADYYIEKLKDTDVILPKATEGNYHAWHLFVIRIKGREGASEALNEKSIQHGIHYPVSLPNQPIFSEHQNACSGFFACNMSMKLYRCLCMSISLEVIRTKL